MRLATLAVTVAAGIAAAHGSGPARADRIVLSPGYITVEQRVTLDDAEAARLEEQLADVAGVGRLLESRLRFLRVRVDGRELPLALVERRLNVTLPGVGLVIVRRAKVPAEGRILVDDGDKDPRVEVVTDVALDGVVLRAPPPRPALLFAGHPLALWLQRDKKATAP